MENKLLIWKCSSDPHQVIHCITYRLMVYRSFWDIAASTYVSDIWGCLGKWLPGTSLPGLWLTTWPSYRVCDRKQLGPRLEKIVEGVKMKWHFPEDLVLKVMPNNSPEMGWTCVVEASVCIWWSAWQTFLVGAIYATQINVCLLVPWVKWTLQGCDLLHTGLYLCFWCSWLGVKCFWHARGPCKWSVGYDLFWCKDYPT